MRYTLLDLVQRILESMESDEVSDINETSEATSVANIIKECYFDIIGDINPAESEGLFKLTASGDNTKPCLMYVPSTTAKISWLKYNRSTLLKPDFTDLKYFPNEEFIYYQTGLDPDDTSIEGMDVTVNGSSFRFRYRNDRMPSSFTIFDETNVIFDAYDVATEATLTAARTLAFGPQVPSFTMSNSWVPDLDPRQFQLLLQDAKRTAFIELKQAANPVAEKKMRVNKILAHRNSHDNDPAWPNQPHASFGRRSQFNPILQAMRRGS